MTEVMPEEDTDLSGEKNLFGSISQPALEQQNFEYQCIVQNERYRLPLPIHLPPSFVAEQSLALESGTVYVCIPGTYMKKGNDGVWTSIVVPGNDGSSLKVLSSKQVQEIFNNMGQQRRLSKTEIRNGIKKLLAVRILANNGSEAPEETISEIRDAIFESEADPSAPTVVSQYAAVSHGALQYVPANGPGIQNGVATVSVQSSIISGNSSIQGDLMVDILESTAASLGNLEDLADHIVFCLPTGSFLRGRNTWTAFTYLYEPVSAASLPCSIYFSHFLKLAVDSFLIGSLTRPDVLNIQYSYYQRSRCTKLSVPMHEIGHSLGFKHSGKGNDSYADESGYMGYAINMFDYPRKAFVSLMSSRLRQGISSHPHTTIVRALERSQALDVRMV